MDANTSYWRYVSGWLHLDISFSDSEDLAGSLRRNGAENNVSVRKGDQKAMEAMRRRLKLGRRGRYFRDLPTRFCLRTLLVIVSLYHQVAFLLALRCSKTEMYCCILIACCQLQNTGLSAVCHLVWKHPYSDGDC